jgi:hypothetical protein
MQSDSVTTAALACSTMLGSQALAQTMWLVCQSVCYSTTWHWQSFFSSFFQLWDPLCESAVRCTSEPRSEWNTSAPVLTCSCSSFVSFLFFFSHPPSPYCTASCLTTKCPSSHDTRRKRSTHPNYIHSRPHRLFAFTLPFFYSSRLALSRNAYRHKNGCHAVAVCSPFYPI